MVLEVALSRSKPAQILLCPSQETSRARLWTGRLDSFHHQPLFGLKGFCGSFPDHITCCPVLHWPQVMLQKRFGFMKEVLCSCRVAVEQHRSGPGWTLCKHGSRDFLKIIKCFVKRLCDPGRASAAEVFCTRNGQLAYSLLYTNLSTRVTVTSFKHNGETHPKLSFRPEETGEQQ